jgi:putative nucleotidyltransferase with HDIG domain
MGNMPGEQADNLAGRRVELAVGQCESISILPSVAARFLSQLGRMELTPGTLAELVESDPAITALVLRLCHGKGIAIKHCDMWLLQAMEVVSLWEIRDAILGAKVLGGMSDNGGTDFRKELTRHSLATGCCAKQLAKLVTPAIDGDTAYLAGLLHDIGKFLLDETMPKSFDTLLEQAREGKKSFCHVEQTNLGIDHTILGKRFAQKLGFASDIILGLWLHHSHAGAITHMPQARIAGIVELANMIVHRAGIGESGSYEEHLPAEAVAETLGLTFEHIKQVEEQLPELVGSKSEAVGLNILKPGWAYCDALRATAGQLASDGSKLFEESQRLQSSASFFDFVKELMPKITSSVSAIELAKDYAAAWQNFYHTGPVCVYFVGETESDVIEGAVAEEPGKAKTVVLELPDDAELVPQAMAQKFVVSDAGETIDWLLEQIDVRFDLSRTKIAPLQAGSKTIGIIVFELRHPVSGDMTERFGPATRFGGAILDLSGTISSEQWYAEKFEQILRAGGLRTEDRGQNTETEAMAEMASGAAHELNNPLSVISGRAQLLAKSENDPDRKRILEQIQQNAGELSAIIDDLMSYANPEQPRATVTSVKQIINEAADLTVMKKKLSRLNAENEIAVETPDVFVDSAQIATAISNIICNALESYDAENGPIKIKSEADKKSRTVSIQITDSGRGMDAQTLAKATQPFFSARPAGRRRGMGLAHAQRLIEINHGKLSISSEAGKGTMVTVCIPYK